MDFLKLLDDVVYEWMTGSLYFVAGFSLAVAALDVVMASRWIFLAIPGVLAVVFVALRYLIDWFLSVYQPGPES